MARLFIPITVVALTVLSVLSLDARLAGVRADDAADCVGGRGDTTIRGCSRIIKSGLLFGEPINKEDLASAYYNRGIAYQHKAQYDRAIADHTQAISLNPKYANAYVNRGIAYEKLGQRDKAIADFQKALELDPSNEKRKEPLKRLGATP